MNPMKATPDDLRHAYRLLLGRDPDPEGFASLAKHINETNAKASDVASMFFASAEFKSRHADVPRLDEIDFDGLRLFPWQGDSLIGDLIKATGKYEAYMLPLFVDSIPVDGTVLDIGANIGVYTLSAARKAGPKGRVFAVEPVAKNVQSLCAGVLGNGFRNVSILPVAASAETGVVPLLRHMNSSNGIVDTHVDGLMVDSFVPSQPIDFLLAGVDSLDVIKIDIEGHEPVAWPSIEVLVRKHRPVVFTEFNPAAIRNHSRVPPEQYLDALFSSAEEVFALHLDGSRIACASPMEAMDQWRDANRKMKSVDGYHLDLLVDARSRSTTRETDVQRKK
jgi:FkbM family methyltransferase